MKKSTYLFILLSFLLPCTLMAQENSKYLAGAVPEVDGKVVFQREFTIPNATQDEVFDRALTWLQNRMKQNENQSRVVYTDKAQGIMAALGEEYIVFSSSALALDRTIVNYQVTITCAPAKCGIEIEKIRYTYQEKEKYTAEEWITDKNALNKNQTKLTRGISKFRIKTVDFVDEFFKEAQLSLNAIPESATVQSSATLSTATPVNTPTTQQVPITVDVSRNISVIGSTPVTAATQTSSLAGYKQISPDRIPGNIIKMLEQDWMLITAGNSEKCNMMTASWGGLGRLYEKPVTTCFINPTRYTYQLMEKNDTYTLTFYTEAYRDVLQYCGTHSGRDADKIKNSGLTPITTPNGSIAFGEAWLIIECRKLVSQSLSHDAINNEQIKQEYTGKQLHKMFIGEIINVWVK